MIRYKKYQNKNEKNVTTFNKWYARAVCEETVDIAALAEHMSTHNTPFSTGAIHGMLKDMVNCITYSGAYPFTFRQLIRV